MFSSCSGRTQYFNLSSYPSVLNRRISMSFLSCPLRIFTFFPSSSNQSFRYCLKCLLLWAISNSSLAGTFFCFRSIRPSLSMDIIFRKISISAFGLSLLGIRQPNIAALTSIKGLRPHHLPSPVRV